MPHGVEEDKAGPSLQFYLSILFYQLYLATLFAHTRRAHTLFVLLPPHYATPYRHIHHAPPPYAPPLYALFHDVLV